MARISTAPPLLQTKLHLPAVRPGRVPRPRLVARLDAAAALPLTLVSSPAGSGKSTLVADWARGRADRPVAWLSLDERDNDLQRFFLYVVAALQRIAPRFGRDLLATLTAPEPPPLDWLLAALLNDAAEAGDLVLVLDDYHALEAPPIHEAMARLVARLPESLRLILITRVDPPLPLAQWRARGGVAEIRTADLRFDHAETGAFLCDSMGLAVGPAEIAALAERTEGWIAGLQLAALSLQGRPGRGEMDRFIADFTGSHRFVLDYLTEEVLARQAPARRRFLLECSILERLSGPLCDAVTGGDDGQAILEQLDGANLFLIQLDERREWFRFHHLFGSLLQHELSRAVDAAGRAALHGRAARWLEGAGLFDEALDHWLRADDTERAADLVEREARGFLKRGDVTAPRAWFERLPESVFARRPRLAVDRAWLLALTMRLRDAHLQAERIEIPLALRGDAELVLHVDTLRALLRSWQGSAAEHLAPITAVLERTPDSDPLIAGILWQHLGMMQRALGALGAGEASLERALALHVEAGNLMSTMFTAWNLAGIAVAGARLADADAVIARALAHVDRVAEEGRGVPGATACALVTLAELRRERGDLDVAERQAEDGVALARKAGVSGSMIEGLVVLARIAASRGRRDAAARRIDEVAAALAPSADRALDELLLTWRARLAADAALADGAPLDPAWIAWAQDERRRREPPTGKGPFFSGAELEFRELARARVLLAVDARAARPELAALGERLAASGHRRAHAEALLLLAAACGRLGDAAGARAALTAALTIAEPAGLVQLVADELPLLAPALAALPPTPFLARVRAAGAATSDVKGAVKAAAPRESGDTDGPLSAREREILGLVARGDSNALAGRRLFIAPATVKKHLENIFGKLGVRNRTQAVDEARRRGILQ